MNNPLLTQAGRTELRTLYRNTLLSDVMPFWMKHGYDREHGGILTALDRDGKVIDTDKSIWFQGRGAWMFSTLYNTVEPKAEWLEVATSAINFLRDHGEDANKKLYFTVTRDGQPLRMRRYVYSESFAAIANAAFARASGDFARSTNDATRYFEAYLSHSFEPHRMLPKVDPNTRPMMGIGPLMICIATAQELRENLGDIEVK